MSYLKRFFARFFFNRSKASGGDKKLGSSNTYDNGNGRNVSDGGVKPNSSNVSKNDNDRNSDKNISSKPSNGSDDREEHSLQNYSCHEGVNKWLEDVHNAIKGKSEYDTPDLSNYSDKHNFQSKISNDSDDCKERSSQLSSCYRYIIEGFTEGEIGDSKNDTSFKMPDDPDKHHRHFKIFGNEDLFGIFSSIENDSSEAVKNNYSSLSELLHIYNDVDSLNYIMDPNGCPEYNELENAYLQVGDRPSLAAARL